MSADGDDSARRYDDLGHVADPDKYKQRRLMATVLDRKDTVIERRAHAYEMFWEGHLNRQEYLTAIRKAVEDYILESEQEIHKHPFACWYWDGLPPTVDGRRSYSPDGERRAVLPGQSVDGVPFEDLTNPIFYTDENGKPPFGTDLNVLGEMYVDEQQSVAFVGLSSVLEAPEKLRFEREQVHDHPLEIQRAETEVIERQIPEDILMAAYRQTKQYWADVGLSMDMDAGLPVQRGFNPAEGEKGTLDREDK